MKTFAELTEREILAVAISSEEEDSRIYMSFAEDLSERYPASAKVFVEMAEEETRHRHMLLEMYEQRFGPNLPPIRRDDVKGFLKRRPVWLSKNLSLDTIRKEAENMEFQAAALLRQGRRADPRRQHPQAPGRPRRDREVAPRHGRQAGSRAPHRERARTKRTARATACSCCNTCSRASPA